MHIDPPGGTGKLGLPAILDAVRERLAGESTHRFVSSWPWPDGAEAVRAELCMVEELKNALVAEERISVDGLPDVAQSLARAAPAGAALSPLELSDLASVCETGARVRAQFARNESRCPTVRTEIMEWEPSEGVAESIRDAIDENGEFRDSASPELRRIRRELASVRASVRKAARKALSVAAAEGYAAEEQPTIRAGRVVIPIRTEAKKRVSGFVHDVSATGQTVYIEPTESLEGNNQVRELEAEERREVERIRRALTDGVRNALPNLRVLFAGLERLDFRLAKARVAVLMNAERPVVEEEGVIRISGARNPALLMHFRNQGVSRAVVPLDMTLDSDTRTIIISGPNAGGKSVAMKTVGLMALMTGMGLLIPVAPESRFDLFEHLFLDIGDEQSIADDLSTFTSHLSNMARFTEAAGSGSLVLIDEAGTGTDPQAGGAIAQAIIERLTERDARTIVTTHFGPLKAFAHETPNVLNASMLFDQEALAPTYVFRPGVPGSSYASEIAERVGLGRDLTERARALMGSGHAGVEELIEDLVRRGREAETKLGDAKKLKADLERARETLADRLSTLQAERDRYRKEALERAESVVLSANSTIERAVREIRESGASKEETAHARVEVEELRKSIEKQARRTARKTRERRTAKPPGKKGTGGAIQPGDQVRLVDGNATGTVQSISGKEAVVVFGSMQMKTDLAKLVKVGGPEKQQVHVRHSSRTGGGLSVQDVKQRIDLRGLRVDEAISKVQSFLDRAMAAGVERVEILHGKGTGALRLAVHEYLEQSVDVRDFEEAPIMEGGAGVTIARF